MRKFKIALRVLLKNRGAPLTHISALDEGQITAPEPESAHTHTIFMYGMLFTFKPSFLQMVSTLRARLSLPVTFLPRLSLSLSQAALALAVFGITPRGMPRKRMLRRRRALTR